MRPAQNRVHFLQNDASEAVSQTGQKRCDNLSVFVPVLLLAQLMLTYERYGRVVARVFLIRFKYVIHRVRTPNKNTHSHTRTHCPTIYILVSSRDSRHIHCHQSFSNGNGTHIAHTWVQLLVPHFLSLHFSKLVSLDSGANLWPLHHRQICIHFCFVCLFAVHSSVIPFNVFNLLNKMHVVIITMQFRFLFSRNEQKMWRILPSLLGALTI